MACFRLLSLLIAAVAFAVVGQGQEPLVPFSNLNGLESSSYFHSTPIEGGYIFYRSTSYLEAEERFDQTFFKLNAEGEITDSVSLPDDDYAYLIGDIIPSENGGFYAVGYRYLSFELLTEANENLNEITSSQRKITAKYDGDLNLVDFQTFDIFPNMQNTLWATILNTGFPPFSEEYSPQENWIVEDTLFSVLGYRWYTFDNDLQITDIGQSSRLEKLSLDGSGNSEIVQLNENNVQYVFLSCAFTGQHFFVFGAVEGPTPPPGSGALPGVEVGQFDLAGQAVAAYGFDIYGSGGLSPSSMGTFHDGKLFTTYLTQITVPDLSCPDNRSVMIDIRDATTFEKLSPRFELPQCGIRPGCKKPFAIHEDDSFSYIAVDRQGSTDTTLYLFRYSSEEELLWRQGYILPGHVPIEIYPTEDGQLLLVCMVEASSSDEDVELRLYKVAPGGIISSATSLGQVQTPPAFHPNPFTDELRLPNPPGQPMRVEVIGINGQPHGHYEAQNGALQLGHLPAGIYLLRMSDAKSGALLGVQRVVKAGG